MVNHHTVEYKYGGFPVVEFLKKKNTMVMEKKM